MPTFNLPNKDDPNYKDKVVDLLQQLFDIVESDIKNLKPIDTPEEGTQVGSFWYDTSDDKVKVMTPSGIKTIQFE